MAPFRFPVQIPAMRSCVSSILLLTCVAASRAAENPVPPPLPIERYEQMLDQSPFALATPQAEPPPAPKDNWANNYVLAGLSKIPDENGVQRWLVIVESRDKREHFEVFGDEEKDGFSVASVDPSPIPRKSTVMMKKGGELGKVEFSQEEAPPAPQMPVPGVQRPGQPGAPGGVVVPGAQPPALGGNRVPGGNNGRIPLPRPNNIPNPAVPNGVVPRPATSQPVVPLPQGAVPAPQAVPAPGVTAYPSPAVPNPAAANGAPQPRRVRVINTQ
jgi:hypothetical protein